MKILTIGDIHGCINQFKALLDKTGVTKKDKLILLGDYIDRGPDSKGVLDMILELINTGYQVTPLLGNHEKMMLDAEKSEEAMAIWIRNGGGETLYSFNCKSILEIPPVYLNLLKKMPFYHGHEDFLFVHAGFNERSETPFLDKDSLLWIRKEEYTSSHFKNKTIVHGHTPSPLTYLKKQLEQKPNVINLDTGCVYKNRYGLGNLSALCLNNMELFWIKNK